MNERFGSVAPLSAIAVSCGAILLWSEWDTALGIVSNIGGETAVTPVAEKETLLQLRGPYQAPVPALPDPLQKSFDLAMWNADQGQKLSLQRVGAYADGCFWKTYRDIDELQKELQFFQAQVVSPSLHADVVDRARHRVVLLLFDLDTKLNLLDAQATGRASCA